MRASLVTAARTLFAEKGYAETGTPEIVSLAGVTRGALYHHFADKAALFRAVVEAEAKAVATEIDTEAQSSGSAIDALLAGSDGYFRAMAVPGRVRLLLLDGPAVLGREEIARIDRETGGGELRIGLEAALNSEQMDAAVLDALTEMLSAAFDRAALSIAHGQPADAYRAAISAILRNLVR